MKRIIGLIVVLFSWSATTGLAASEVGDLTAVTGTNIGLVSAKLSEHQKGINDIATRRIDLIASVRRMAAEKQLEVDREIAVLKQTGGSDVVKLLDALREHADSAAAAPTQLDAVQAQAKNDLSAVYKPLAISTDKLDGAAKTLASLAEEKSRKERAEFLISFLKEAREDVNNLEKNGSASKASGDQKLEAKVSALEQPKKPDTK